MSIYDESIPQLKKMLGNLDRWLEAAIEYAKTKSFDPNVFVTARLAPDQFSFARQVQAACDQAKFGAARLLKREAPKHPDTEQTIDELRARIKTCIGYLDTFTKEEFEGAEKNLLELPFLEGKLIKGEVYIRELTLPNFYFHVTTAYAILRHNGVPVGKRDFLGKLALEAPEAK